MDMSSIAEYARALHEAYGDKAEAEAARKAKDHEDAGETSEAETWHQIRKAIREMRGAPES